MAIERVRWEFQDGHDAWSADFRFMTTEFERQIEKRFRAVSYDGTNESNGVASGLEVASITDAVVIGTGVAYDNNFRSQITLEDAVTLAVTPADVGSWITIEAGVITDDNHRIRREGHPATGFSDIRRLVYDAKVAITAAPSSVTHVKLAKIDSHTLGEAPVLSTIDPNRQTFSLKTIKGEIIQTPWVTVATDNSGDFTDIQAAIDSLPDGGGLVFIRNGEYVVTETIRTDKKGVVLMGAGPSTRILGDIESITPGADGVATIIDFNGPLTGTNDAGENLFRVIRRALIGVTMDWKTPDSFAPTIPNKLVHVMTGASRSLIVRDCLFINTPGISPDGWTTGVAIKSAGDLTQVEDCTFRDIAVPVGQLTEPGGSTSFTAAPNTGTSVRGCVMTGVTKAGVWNTEGSGFQGINNGRWRASGNIMVGINLLGSEERSFGVRTHRDGLVKGNVIRQFSSGIRLTRGETSGRVFKMDVGSVAMGNVCVDNREYGITMTGGLRQMANGNVTRSNDLGNVLTSGSNVAANNSAN